MKYIFRYTIITQYTPNHDNLQAQDLISTLKSIKFPQIDKIQTLIELSRQTLDQLVRNMGRPNQSSLESSRQIISEKFGQEYESSVNQLTQVWENEKQQIISKMLIDSSRTSYKLSKITWQINNQIGSNYSKAKQKTGAINFYTANNEKKSTIELNKQSLNEGCRVLGQPFAMILFIYFLTAVQKRLFRILTIKQQEQYQKINYKLRKEMMKKNFISMIENSLKSQSQQLRDYLIATYISRSDFFMNGNDNQYLYDSQLPEKNKQILKSRFTGIKDQNIEKICSAFISHQLENLSQEEVNSIVTENNEQQSRKTRKRRNKKTSNSLTRKIQELNQCRKNREQETKPILNEESIAQQ